MFIHRRALLSLLLALAILVLASCAKPLFSTQNTIIDWVDFVKLNGMTYEGMHHSAVLADPGLVTDQVAGVVKFNVEQNVSNPSYQIKDGDAAFLEKGTELYVIAGIDPEYCIGVKNNSVINGYKIYRNRDYESGPSWKFQDLDQSKVKTIKIYEGYNGSEQLVEYKGEEILQILDLLNSSEQVLNYEPYTKEGDLKYYRMVLMDGNPIVQVHTVNKDDINYYWHPDSTQLLSVSISEYLRAE
jgi:hypothetical protein